MVHTSAGLVLCFDLSGCNNFNTFADLLVPGVSVSRRFFGHNRSRSQCSQVQPVKCRHLGFVKSSVCEPHVPLSMRLRGPQGCDIMKQT